MIRTGKIARVTCFTIVVMSLVFGGLMAPSGTAAYTGETNLWRMDQRRGSERIVVSSLDTGDVNANTMFAEQIDAAFVRESFGSNIKNIRSGANLIPLPGTTVIRTFTFTANGQKGFLLVIDEFGPKIWFFMFSSFDLNATALESFISDTVLNGMPMSIPLGYGPAVLQD